MTEKESNLKSKKSEGFVKIIKKNPWMPLTFVFGIVLVLVLLTGFSFSNVSEKKASSEFVEFINSAGGSQIDSLSSKEYGSNLYEVIVVSDGQEIPVHITKDGKYFVQVIAPLTGDVVKDSDDSENPQPEPEPQNIPKSEKPVVELFVMSHCPYGTQAEKGILPVVELLGDKIDFELRFVYYAMHPSSGEVEEQLNQYCIQEEQEELFLDYLTCFLGKTGTPADAEACREEVGVDDEKLTSCYDRVNDEFNVLGNLEDKSSWLSGRYPLFDIDKDLNEEYGIRGSPTLVINGQEASSGRAPANYLSTICASFSEGNVPEECSESLSSSTYNPGFGWTVSSSSGSTAAQCG